MTLRVVFGRACRETRLALDLTQEALAAAVGVSRGYIARVEHGQVNVTVDVVDRIAERLGQRLELAITPPVFLSDRRAHDRVHAWCVETVARRLIAAGWRVGREVQVSDGRMHGWIDLLAFDPDSGTLLAIEVKTRLDDIGGIQRQIGWYEGHAVGAARPFQWVPARTVTWLIALASEEIEQALAQHRSLFDQAFPGRAAHMLEVLRRTATPTARGVALIDPRSKRRDWLFRTRLDGRRSPLPYRDYADAARRLAG